jgi:hypothetical protein
MKRDIFVSVAMLAPLAGLAGCSSPSASDARVDQTPASGWTRPPEILSVARGTGTLIFSGEAQPGARVVLRSDAGAAFAAAADEAGQFQIRMVAPAGAVLLRPETQVGQESARSPDHLLILEGGRGPIAILRPGGPTRRLDAAPALDAIDSDGRAALASGRVARGAGQVSVVAGQGAVAVSPDPRGRWSVVLGETGAGEQIRVAGQTFEWPGPGAAGAPLQAERVGAGWRVGWSGPAGARQWTWMPDAGA